jgi:transposase
MKSLVNVPCRYRASPNRLQITTPAGTRRIRAHIRWLEKELNHTDGDLEEVVEAGTGWKENEALLRSLPGVDLVLARTLLAKLPELGTLTHKHLYALVGVLPLTATLGRGAASGRCGAEGLLSLTEGL